MNSWVHFLSFLMLAVIFYPIYNWKVLFILAGGVLIDIDHYFLYVFRFKKFNLFHCYTYFRDENNIKKHIGCLLIFHTIEFLLILLLLSFYFEFVLIFMIGSLTHYLLDLTWYYFVPKRLVATHSIISCIIKNKIQKV
jgi:hypothetical protein